ncbi:hypothetical protein [Flavobacterium sp. AG291]|uniref:hypothetical protein n=1 Tax=Flavobacterium sp. AG291 TaxID=2184000 RepID=UPI000E0BEB0E|nr:hypothetical protein [Flavobacterium sp. AG291]RDI07069.1 hypothetical protein DEU42_113169 [Flavobacterium sp. AG291]
MAKLKESTKEKKARRNAKVLERYNELKKLMTCRETYPLLSDEFNLSESTIKSILFIKTYSLSPLPQNDANSGELKIMPV